MKKFITLILGLSLTAASCNFITDPLGGASGERGVFVSEDAGESFHTANQLDGKGDINGVSVNMLTFDPSNPEIMYLASGSGIYKTENGGGSWKYILTGIAVADIAVHPFDNKILYASGLSNSNGKIIKSNDGGTTWVDAYNEPTKDNAVLSVAISTYNSKVVLAGLNNGEIIRSSDDGHTWQSTKDFEDRVLRVRFSGSTGYVLTLRNGLSKTTDAGATWQQLTSSVTGDVFTNRNADLANVSLFHDLALDVRQSGVLYLGTEEGVLRSVNDGTSWGFVNLPVRDTSTKVTALAVNPKNSNNLIVAVGTTIFKSNNGGVTWETKRLGTGHTVRNIVINPQSTNYIYLGLGDKK